MAMSRIKTGDVQGQRLLAAALKADPNLKENSTRMVNTIHLIRAFQETSLKLSQSGIRSCCV
jgi:hypothetical protein